MNVFYYLLFFHIIYCIYQYLLYFIFFHVSLSLFLEKFNIENFSLLAFFMRCKQKSWKTVFVSGMKYRLKGVIVHLIAKWKHAHEMEKFKELKKSNYYQFNLTISCKSFAQQFVIFQSIILNSNFLLSKMLFNFLLGWSYLIN